MCMDFCYFNKQSFIRKRTIKRLSIVPAHNIIRLYFFRQFNLHDWHINLFNAPCINTLLKFK